MEGVKEIQEAIETQEPKEDYSHRLPMIAFKLVPRLISSVRDFGNLTLKNEDALRQPWPEVLCS